MYIWAELRTSSGSAKFDMFSYKKRFTKKHLTKEKTLQEHQGRLSKGQLVTNDFLVQRMSITNDF